MTACAICDGVGLVRVMDAAGHWVSRPCECQEAERELRRLAAAGIPRKYLNCTLDTFEIDFNGANPLLGTALRSARKFVEAYPVDTGGKGLLIVGPNGVGKTHLAIGVLRRLVRERGVKGLFCDYRELLKKIQNSYNPQVQATELDVLTPMVTVEVLVIDDLGTQKPSDWAWDTVPTFSTPATTEVCPRSSRRISQISRLGTANSRMQRGQPATRPWATE